MSEKLLKSAEKLPIADRRSEQSEMISDMIKLHWPEYHSFDEVFDIAMKKRGEIEAVTNMLLDQNDIGDNHLNNEFYLPAAWTTQDISKWDNLNPVESRREELEIDLQRVTELSELLSQGPFAACNPNVARAFRLNIKDATNTLRDAMDCQEDGADKYEAWGYDYDAGLTAQALLHTLAGVAVQLGALPAEEAYVYYSTQATAPLVEAKTTMNDGQINRYETTYLAPLEPGTDESDNWTATTRLSISAVPGKRVAFELGFGSDNLSERFHSDTINGVGRKYLADTFSIRFDYDNKSPNGLSLDIGRDDRLNESFSRDGDSAGKSLQLLRPDEGSHFSGGFDGVSYEDMEEFIEGIRNFLRADAEMSKYDSRQSQSPKNFAYSQKR